MNKRYFISREGSDILIFRCEANGVIEAISKEGFKNATARISVRTGPKDKPNIISVTNWWLAHPKGREYEEVIFNPETTPPRCFNYWDGFAVQPVKGNCSLMKQHIKEIICCGNTAYYEYFMDLLALRFQKPWVKIEVAIVLMSEIEGTGKGVVGDWLYNNIGKKFAIKISRPQDLIGRFNSHLERALFVFSDEAIWSGDHAAARVLKSFITEDELLSEAKYKQPKMVKNRSLVLISTNETHAITAGIAARRFFMLKVSDNQHQNENYFTPLQKQVYSSGGLEAFHQELLCRDISTFNHRNVPKTAELKNQQKMSGNSIDEWLLECVSHDCLAPASEHTEKLGKWVYGGTIRGQYVLWCNRNNKHIETNTAFGIRLKRLGMPSIAEPGKGKNKKGRHMLDAADLNAALDALFSG
jgi:hypothetical protein